MANLAVTYRNQGRPPRLQGITLIRGYDEGVISYLYQIGDDANYCEPVQSAIAWQQTQKTFAFSKISETDDFNFNMQQLLYT
jgi:hypothetical protein